MTAPTTGTYVTCVAITLLIQAALVFATRQIAAVVTGGGDIAFVTPLVSAGGGFLLINRRLDTSQSMMFALLYFPVMYPVLMYFSLVVVGFAYGDWL
jgi:hypothetical protein